MNSCDISIIGGGPAGMVCAILAKRNNRENNITIYERNEKLGKKLYITGKGRCNVTNASDVETLLNNTYSNPYFMYSAYYGFDSYMTMEFFEGLGVPLKIERGNRVFPVSDRSSQIVKALENEIKRLNIKVKLNTYVQDIISESGQVVAIKVNNEIINTDKVVLCTGGLSYPVTGSDGNGHKIAKKLEHNITKLYPSLVPLKVSKEYEFFTELQGLSLKNVNVTAKIDNKKVYSNQGEMMFTHVGVTGPLILTTSRYFAGNYHKKCSIEIDLKPALSRSELDKRLLKDFDKYKNKDFKNSLDELLPQKMIPIIIKLSEINPDKKVNEITKDERKKLCDTLKCVRMDIQGDNGYNEAVITAGGVSVDDINPSTCESKIVHNLFLCGEIIDVDCFTGGFNLQVAYSTANLVASSL